MDIEQFGLFIAARRKDLGMTQQELADLVGVTNKAVSKWERGLSIPDISLFKSIALHLDVNIIDLLSAGDLMDSDQVEKKEVESLMEKALVSIQNFNYKKIINLVYTILMIGCTIGLFVSLGVDLFLNQTFTWSLISTASILGAMLVVTVARFNYKNLVNLAFSTLFTGLLISIPIVSSVQFYLSNTVWFFNEFIYYNGGALVSVIIAYIYFIFSKSNKWVKMHMTLIIMDAIGIIVQWFVIDDKLMMIPNFVGLFILLITHPLIISRTKKEDF